MISKIIWIVLSLILGAVILTLLLGAMPFGKEANTTLGSYLVVSLAVGSILHGVLNTVGVKPGPKLVNLIGGTKATEYIYPKKQTAEQTYREEVRGTKFYIS